MQRQPLAHNGAMRMHLRPLRPLRTIALALGLGASLAAVAGVVGGNEISRAFMASHVTPLGLPGQSLETAFQRLSENGMNCRMNESPVLFCHVPAAQAPTGCGQLDVSVYADNDAWPKAHDVAERVADILGRTAKSVVAGCWPALAPPELDRFAPMSDASSTSMRQIAETLAGAAPDLRTLMHRLIAAQADCRWTADASGTRLACSGGDVLHTDDCSDGNLVFHAADPRDGVPRAVEATCTRGRYIPPEPSPADHDRWAEFGVTLVAEMCAMQDPAYRAGGPAAILWGPGHEIDWSHADQTPVMQCLRKRHWLPDALCGEASRIDLADGRQAIAFIHDQKTELARVKPALDFFYEDRKPGVDPGCPELALPAAASAPR